MGAQVRILPVATICFIRPFYPASGGKLSSPSSFTRGSLAEWSKALVLGTSPKGRGQTAVKYFLLFHPIRPVIPVLPRGLVRNFLRHSFTCKVLVAWLLTQATQAGRFRDF